jgi:hypothetical protein
MSGFTRLRGTAIAFALLLPVGAAIAPPAATASAEAQSLDMYTATVSDQAAAELSRTGVDVTAARPEGSKVKVDLVLSAQEAKGLRARGIGVQLKRTANGQTVRQLAAAQQAAGYTVYRSWDEPGGIRDELRAVARANPGIVKLVVLGHTGQGRQLIALKVTAGARHVRDGSRPAVLYSGTQHAREWIATEVSRRMLHYFVDGWNAHDPSARAMLAHQEFWFMPVMNPDGYQYTFDHERLWRKNLRDNDGDGQVSASDGVDPNRNYPDHFNYDNEGSSSLPSSETYHGPYAASEPETRAAMRLFNRVPFKFMVNYHSYGPYLLYPEGWQIGTPTQDDPIYYALAGNLDKPAIPDTHPGLSSDVLYATNGESDGFAQNHGTLAWTPELEEGCEGCGFVFPDDEALIQAQFEKQLPFALDVARSAPHPANPVSHLGLTTKPFYLHSDDTYKAGLPLANFAFDVSYGNPQEVRILAKRSIGPVTLKYQVNGGRVVKRHTTEWQGGERYGGKTDIYYHIMRGAVTRTSAGDSVKVWFTGGGKTSESFTYRVATKSRHRVLIMSAEDYTGASPVQASGPNYLAYYEDALTANHVGYDVYDVDAMGRKAPDHLGVLSHYDAVIWYTGDDAITREPGWTGGNASRLAMDEMLQIRDYLNEGGRVLYTGKYAGHQYTLGHGTQLYDPTAANEQCSTVIVTQPLRCIPLAGTGDSVNDVLEYWLGASILIEDSGFNADTDNLFDVLGTDRPFTGLNWGFNGTDSAQNQDHSASFITTSGLLDPATYPQFRSWVSAKYDRPGGPFAPHTGDAYAYSQIGDVSYKRLSHTITVPAGGADLSFWTSRVTELDWDYVFVEAHTVGQDNWTTLADLNGHTSTDTGESCPAGWDTLHPQLDHYQTFSAGPPPTCTSTGTTGSWNAATGDSGGWEQWDVDLSAYAGTQVEVSITYASDWSTQGLGVFIDDIVSSTGEGTTSFEDDGDPLDGWVAGGAPDSAPNPNDFEVTTAAGFPEGSVVSTPASVYMGFGFEGISDAANRATVMHRAIQYLLR